MKRFLQKVCHFSDGRRHKAIFIRPLAGVITPAVNPSIKKEI
jgi:hypothetical protein